MYASLRKTLVLFCLSGLLPLGCAAPYTVRTAGASQTVLIASVGGPLIGNIGGAVPVPAVVVGAKHGLTDDWDVHGTLHITPMVYRNAAWDLGVTRRLLKECGFLPEVTATFRLPMITDFQSFRTFPELEAYASYLIKNRALVYLGMSTFFDFFWPRDNHVKVHWGPAIGTDIRFRQRFSMGISLRWISPQQDTGTLVVDWVSPGKLGMFFVQIGFQAHLQKGGRF